MHQQAANPRSSILMLQQIPFDRLCVFIAGTTGHPWQKAKNSEDKPAKSSIIKRGIPASSLHFIQGLPEVKRLTGAKMHFATFNNTKVGIVSKLVNDAKLLTQTAAVQLGACSNILRQRGPNVQAPYSSNHPVPSAPQSTRIYLRGKAAATQNRA